MKYCSVFVMLACLAALQLFSSCSAFTYTYADGYGYGSHEITADTSRWWLKPVYIRTDTSTSADSLKTRNFVWFHDDEQGMTYVKVSGDNSILFESRSANLTYKSALELVYIGTLLEDKPFSEMIIYGSADNTESRDYSQELSEERAESAAEFLENMGYNPDVIHVIGLGDTDPAASNRTMEGRALNRYVDVFVTIADGGN